MKISVSFAKKRKLKAVIEEDENCRGVFLSTDGRTSVLISENGHITPGFTSLEDLLKNGISTRKPVYEEDNLTITF